MTQPRESRGGLEVTFALALMLSIAHAGCATSREEEEKPDPTAVKTALSEEGPITEWLELQGRVAPPYDRDAVLAPQVSGRIVFLAARVGDEVKEGAVLARVESGPVDDELKAAEAAARRSDADLAFKRSVAKRSRDLVAKGVASREEAESADAAAVAAESALAEDTATLASARRRQAWAELKAPFSGVVVRVDRRIGDFVDGTAATPVVEIAAADGWEIVASATSSWLQRLRPGQAASIVGLDNSEEGTQATVVGIARAVDPATGAGDVRFAPRTRPEGTALGSPVQVRVAVQSRAKAVLVPKAALRKAADGSTEVVVVEGGIAHVTKIEAGLTESDRVEVISGLSAGVHVVIEDPIGIADGAALVEESQGDDKDAKGEKDEKAGKEEKSDKARETKAKEPAVKEPASEKK